MKFLIDNAVSPVVSQGLNKIGYDSIHVREIGLQDAEDIVIFEKALEDKRVIISSDTDFGSLLSQWHKNKPSVMIFRKGAEREPLKQIELLKLNLTGQLLKALEQGALVIIETNRIRVRSLPIFK